MTEIALGKNNVLLTLAASIGQNNVLLTLAAYRGIIGHISFKRSMSVKMRGRSTTQRAKISVEHQVGRTRS